MEEAKIGEDKITLNGIEYIKADAKKTEHKLIKRFPISTEYILLNRLKRILTETGEESIGEEEAVNMDRIAVTDPANVAMIEAKSEQAKRLLSRFYSKEDEHKLPEWDFIAKTEEKNSCKYSLEYLDKFIKIMGVTDDACIISMLKDHPIQIENKHFKCIIAPRVNGEDS